MITIARVDFDGLRMAINEAESLDKFNEQYIGSAVPYPDIQADIAETGDDENEALERQRELQWLKASDFQLLKAFFYLKKEQVTYDNFRQNILPEIRGMVDPFYRDRVALQKIVECYGWESHNHIFTFKDITDQYIDEGLIALNWHEVKTLPCKCIEAVMDSIPNQNSWDSMWEHFALCDVFSTTQTEVKPIYKSGEIVEYKNVPKKMGKRPIRTGACAVICTNEDGTRDLHIF